MLRDKRALRFASLAGIASVLALGRWLWQGTGNVWSKLDYKVYVADADLGWRRTEDTFAWVGIDVVALLAGGAVATYVLLRILGNRRSSWSQVLVRATQGVAVASLLLPLYAFATGAPPSGAKESRPASKLASPTGGIRASLPNLPKGRYITVAHAQSAVIAKLSAGGEVFDARFGGGLVGHWDATPDDLTAPMTATVSVDARSIDTGIDLRNKHALEDLRPDEHPQIRFTLGSVSSTERSRDGIDFAAKGEVVLGGRTHKVDVNGSLHPIGDALRDKLSLSNAIYALLQANFSLNLKDTIIGNDGTFDVDDVPISVTLILQHTEK